MSSKRRSYDTDEITLRKVFAKSVVDNTNIGAMKVLTADGAGGTYWTIPSTNGAWNPSFNRIATNAGNFTADLSYNTFTMSEGTGIGFTKGSGTNQLYIYGKSFTQVDVSGNNSIAAFENNQLDPILRMEATGGITIRSNPATNMISFDGTGVQVSSSLYSFQKAKVINNTSTITDGVSSLSNFIILNSSSPSSILSFVGIGDIILSTNSMANSIFFRLNQSTGSISSLYGYIDSISSLYTKLSDFSTATASLSTIAGSNFSTGTSTSYGINSNLSIVVFNLPFNQYTTLQQFNFTTGNLTNAVSTISTNYTPLPALFSTSIGIQNRISTFDTVSSASTVFIYGGNVTNFSASNVFYIGGDLSTFSTTTGVTFQGVSTQIAVLTQQVSTLSTVSIAGLSSLSTAFAITLPSTILGLGTYGYLSSPSLLSSMQGLATSGFINSASLLSTVEGLGTAGYLSSQSLTSTVDGLNTGLYSTVQGLGTALYVSTSQLTSSFQGLSNVAVTKLIQGTNITLSGSQGEITISASGGGGGGGGGGISYFSTSFTSSIYYQGANSTVVGVNDINRPATFYFSTADVYLDKFSSYILSTSRILIDYRYTMRFTPWLIDSGTNSNTQGNVVSFSTALSYSGNIDLNNVATDEFTTGYPLDVNSSNYNNYFPVTSNSIFRRTQFQVSTVGVMSAYTSPVQLYHRFDECLFSRDTSLFPTGDFFAGFGSSTINLLYSSTNSVFVTIQN